MNSGETLTKSKVEMSLDRVLHVATIASMVLGGAYFIFRLEGAIEILAERMVSVDTKIVEHRRADAHGQARDDIRELSNSVAKLHQIAVTHEKEINMLRNNK